MWQRTIILKSEQVAEDMRSVLVRPIHWVPHKAGQHYELRIPGSLMSRKYSVVSSPNRTGVLEFGIQLIKNGVLSPKLWQMKEGGEIEIQGPLGESFVWEPSLGGPLILIGAGSGITPLLCMYDAYMESNPERECIFIMSAKNERNIMRYDKLRDSLVTRFTEREKRVNKEFLEQVTDTVSSKNAARCYVCGPDGFIDSVVDYLLELDFPASNIRSERFI